jgi:hypothetical protein
MNRIQGDSDTASARSATVASAPGNEDLRGVDGWG